MSSFHYNPTEDPKRIQFTLQNPSEVNKEDEESKAEQAELFQRYESQADTIKHILDQQRNDRKEPMHNLSVIRSELNASYDFDVKRILEEIMALHSKF